MNLVLFGDRDVLHQEGVCHFLAGLHRALEHDHAVTSRTWREHLYNAIEALTRGEPLLNIAQNLGRTLSATLCELDTAGYRSALLRQELTEARNQTAECENRLKQTPNDASVYALRQQVQTLQRQLTTAQEANARQALALEAERCTVAQREAAIAELQGVITKQHLEFEALFGEMDSLE